MSTKQLVVILVGTFLLAAASASGIVYVLMRTDPKASTEQVERVEDKHTVKIRELEAQINDLSSALARTQERVRIAEQNVAKKRQELRDVPKPSGMPAAEQVERFQKLRP